MVSSCLFGYGDVSVMSWGYIEPNKASVTRAPVATKYVSQLLTKVQWGELDILIIDTPPGTGDILMTLTQSLEIDGAVIVTTGNEMSVADMLKGMTLLEKVDIPTLAVCQNMTSYECEKCHHKHKLFSDSAGDQILRLLESYPEAELHHIPLDRQLSTAPLQPMPPQLHAYPYIRNPDHDGRPASCALHGLAAGLLASFLAARPRVGPDARADLKLRPGGVLEFQFPSGEVLPVPCSALRAACRCAKCVDEFTGEQILDREQVLKNTSLRATASTSVGNYGIQVVFSDGHSALLPRRVIEQIARDALALPAAAG